MSLIDSFIGFFSPEAGFKRAQYREAINVSKTEKRKYEGASRSRRTTGWFAPSSSANSETSNQLEILRNRCRDLVRNNPHAGRAVSIAATNTIGRGIIANFQNENTELAARQELLWNDWVSSREKVDFDCCLDFNGIQNLIMRSVVESGEVLIRRRRVRGGLGIKLQVLEADHLATNRVNRNEKNGNRVIQGVEVDKSGCPVAYHLFKNHPGNAGIDMVDVSDALDIVRVPADDIIHVFRKERPGQVRGVPWLSPVMIRLRELDEFEDAMLVRQKIAACFSAFVHDIEPPADINNGKQELDIEKLEPGIIEYLPPGKDIKFATPPLPQGEAYKFFVQSQLHAIAAGVNLTFEALTGDLSEVNFSSARMGWLEFARAVDSWRWNMFIPQCNKRVFNWFSESASIMGEDMSGTRAGWTPPRREMIDPTKEVPAKIRAIRAGIESLSDVVRQGGKIPSEHFAEMAADNKMLDDLGLVLDTDPRKITIAGMFQAEDEPPEAEESARRLQISKGR